MARDKALRVIAFYMSYAYGTERINDKNEI